MALALKGVTRCFSSMVLRSLDRATATLMLSGPKGYPAERRVEDVVGVAELGDARVFAAVGFPRLGGDDELAAAIESAVIGAGRDADSGELEGLTVEQ